MEALCQQIEPTLRAIQSATTLLECLKELNKTNNSLVNNLFVPEVK